MKKKKLKLKKQTLYLMIGSILIIGGGVIAGFLIFNKKPANKKEEINPPESYVPSEVKVVDTSSTSRPYAVMINNHPSARAHHTGLQDALVTYEIIVEGGLTRYIAIYKDQNTAKIGSVRSARHYFLDYAFEHDAYYVHWGWSPLAESDIKNLRVNNINGLTYEGSYFYRDNSLNVDYEHRGFTNMEQLNKAVAKLGYRTETNKDLLFQYSADAVDFSSIENKQSATEVSVKYSNAVTSSYVYDENAKVYKRSVNGISHSDDVSKKQYIYKNIITYQVANNSVDSYGRQDINNIGSGSGYYITEGIAVPITWEKTKRDGQTIYKYANGERIVLNDGNTFIQIQPKGQTLNIK